jgi:5,6,7,8-tetrahydromethanopterin hydro-lyase
MEREQIDGRIGEAWSGEVPNGSHINLVLAWRGSPTAAVAVSALANPRAGHAPVVVCLGAGNAVRPITIMTNKATATEDLHKRITWGAAQLGIGQAVMDAVADGTLPAELAGDLVVLVAAWVDPEAGDETACRLAARDATRRAIDDALAGAPAAQVERLAGLREAARNQFYGGS